MGELGRRVLTSGSITTSIDRLERDGLVERMPASDDRRSRIVHLTKSGGALIRARFEAHERDMDRAFAALSAAETRELVTILSKLGPVVDERNP
jgi:MarR family 2-MHQ and catechol resistance regulon transcriptional repressor